MSYRLDRKGTLVILIIVLLVLPALPPILKVQDQAGVSAEESTNQAQIIVNPNQGKRGSIIEITLTNQVVQLGSLVTSIKPEGVIILMRDVSKDGKIGSYGEFHLIPVYQGDVQPDWVEIAKDTWKRSYYVYEAAMEGPNIISCGDLQTPFTVIGNQPVPETNPPRNCRVHGKAFIKTSTGFASNPEVQLPFAKVVLVYRNSMSSPWIYSTPITYTGENGEYEFSLQTWY